jgi:hypothetical protein
MRAMVVVARLCINKIRGHCCATMTLGDAGYLPSQEKLDRQTDRQKWTGP